MALTNDDRQWIKGAITDGVVEALETIVLPRLDEHDKRFDAIEKRLDSVEGRLDSVEGKLDAVEGRLDAVEGRLDLIENRLTSVESRLTALESDMRDVKNHLERLDWQVEALTNDIREIYAAIYKKPNRTLVSESFRRLGDEDKIMIMHEELLKMAKKKNITLAQ